MAADLYPCPDCPAVAYAVVAPDRDADGDPIVHVHVAVAHEQSCPTAAAIEADDSRAADAARDHLTSWMLNDPPGVDCPLCGQSRNVSLIAGHVAAAHPEAFG